MLSKNGTTTIIATCRKPHTAFSRISRCPWERLFVTSFIRVKTGTVSRQATFELPLLAIVSPHVEPQPSWCCSDVKKQLSASSPRTSASRTRSEEMFSRDVKGSEAVAEGLIEKGIRIREPGFNDQSREVRFVELTLTCLYLSKPRQSSEC